MEIGLDEVKRQVEELPIGYYAKRRVPMVMSIDEPTSFYNVTEDEITISYPIIAEGLKNAKEDESYKETAIRSMVYHELSHVILTPIELMDFANTDEDREIFNIFEDERIETILKDFYMDVNFKKNVLYINGGTITTPTTPMQAFYNLVRFRAYNDANLLKKVDKIIKDYHYLNHKSNDLHCYHYSNEIRELYKQVCKQFKANTNNTMPSESDIENITTQINNSDNMGNGYNNNDKADGTKSSKENETGESNETSDENGDSAEVAKEGDNNGHDGNGGANLFDTFDKMLNAYRDSQTTEMLKAIINTFNKKTNSGNGCTGYSGVFNPRNIRNNDYKYFDRNINAKGNNKYGKFHLNLFIDESGSFYNLEDSANTLIASLVNVERTNPNFTFDLICDSYGFRETPKKKRIIRANGGNVLTYDAVCKMMQKHIKKDSYNYNIVLHDGYVRTNGNKDCFLGWDRNNVTIIDTGDNEFHLKQLKNAKIVVSKYGNLVKNLGAEVAKILKTAFR